MARFFKVVHPDGSADARSAESRVYTHATVCQGSINGQPESFSAWSYHNTEIAARANVNRLNRNWDDGRKFVVVPTVEIDSAEYRRIKKTGKA